MESYTTIQCQSQFEYEDRKSIFIGNAAPVSTEQQALDFIAYIKKKYPDAKHHVYAYVLRENSIMRFTDDREPQGTAGMPVLDSIRKNNCVDTVIVVIRYFGGTLLGTGGLVRAYSAAATGALKSANIITYDVYSSMALVASYSDFQKLSPIISQHSFKVDDTKYSDNVTVTGKILASEKDTFISTIIEATSGRCECTVLGEKFDFI